MYFADYSNMLSLFINIRIIFQYLENNLLGLDEYKLRLENI